MIAALAFLAIVDLVVGVSNDAVNFLNSAIGSKAVSYKTIIIVASIGVAAGALTSSGMMEVARKGIFNPGEFMFNEIMIIFMAVMITDILLLDFFNSVGMPTSTTVSIVFELLGASVCMALIKISNNDSQTLLDLGHYINNEKAIEIIFGILLSVAIAFTVGAIVQWFSRILLTFKFEQKPSFYGSIFSGLAITSIAYFIIIKGLSSATFMHGGFIMSIVQDTYILLGVNFVFWTIISFLLFKVLKINIYKIIVVIGTFALALAFAGNDLVNFIGVPIAALNSYELWHHAYETSNAMPTSFAMTSLSKAVTAQPFLLLIAGLVMVLTLWFSRKAKDVVKTSVDLSRQDDIKERFQPNFLSRGFVRFSINMSQMASYILPNSWQTRINKRFEKPEIVLSKDKNSELPAFDMVRAAVNLMVAAVLISIATSMKLPLSTTYVTFMVAMGSSLADRAWGAESAVYRVAGVLNVIGGWFFTALVAFTASALIAYLINIHVPIMVSVLLVLALILIARNYMSHNKKLKESKAEDKLIKAESRSLQGVIHESASNIANVIKRGNKIFSNAINGLAKQDLASLKKNNKQVNKLAEEIEDLKDNIYYFIKNLDDPSVHASNFYIHILGYLQDMTQSLEYISKASHKHINNNHKKLKFSQIKELKEVDERFEKLFENTQKAFESRSFEEIGNILTRKEEISKLVKTKIQKQVERTRSEEQSPKNTTLYFSVLLETNDLLNAIMNLLEEYYNSHDSSVKPATIHREEEE